MKQEILHTEELRFETTLLNLCINFYLTENPADFFIFFCVITVWVYANEQCQLSSMLPAPRRQMKHRPVGLNTAQVGLH